MNILFVHQNMPGQFKHLAPNLGADPRHRVVFLTRREGVSIPNVEVVTYKVPREATAATHQYVRLFENGVIAGQEVVRQAQAMRRSGFVPDVIVAHSGWGEALFLKDVFPKTPLVTYSEFYYRPQELYFEPGREVSLDQVCRLRARNANLLLSLEACDLALAPTRWQKSVQPAAFHDKIRVIFDGIDTRRVAPDPAATFTLGDRALTRADEVVTYVARNLEPYRGFPSFVRALPRLLELRPAARVVIVGGDNVSYGSAPPGGSSWRETMLAEVGGFDRSRVHFIPKLGYGDYLRLLQVSSAHVYLTYPFVLSWSFMEAMAAGCLVIGSATPPVEEVIVDGVNGLLTDFHAPDDIARTIADALAAGPTTAGLRENARGTVRDRYELGACLARQKALLAEVTR